MYFPTSVLDPASGASPREASTSGVLAGRFVVFRGRLYARARSSTGISLSSAQSANEAEGFDEAAAGESFSDIWERRLAVSVFTSFFGCWLATGSSALMCSRDQFFFSSNIVGSRVEKAYLRRLSLLLGAVPGFFVTPSDDDGADFLLGGLDATRRFWRSCQLLERDCVGMAMLDWWVGDFTVWSALFRS
jgi:hypothetical protein